MKPCLSLARHSFGPSRSRVAALALALAAAGAVTAGATEARAQSANSQAALEFANKGLAYFNSGDYERAYVHFDQAELRMHAPTHLLYMARAQRRRGLLLEARDIYQRIVIEDLGAAAPEPFRKAQEDARAETSDLAMKIPGLRIVLKGAPEADAVVKLNGNQVSPREFGRKELNPGRYQLEASGGGGPAVVKNVEIAEGATQTVEFQLGNAPKPVGPLAAPNALPSPNDQIPGGSGRGSSVPAILAYSVGVAGLGVGIVTGLLSLGKVSDLERDCPNKVCPASSRTTADSAQSLGTASTAGFIVGGIGLATGTVLLLTYQPGTPSTDGAGATTARARTMGFRLKGSF